MPRPSRENTPTLKDPSSVLWFDLGFTRHHCLQRTVHSRPSGGTGSIVPLKRLVAGERRVRPAEVVKTTMADKGTARRPTSMSSGTSGPRSLEVGNPWPRALDDLPVVIFSPQSDFPMV